MLENILTKNGRALLGIAFSFLLSNASLEAVRTYRSWNLEEDHLLRRAVETLGAVNWTAIAALFPGRTATQCRQHWNDYLNPAINRGPWTKAEDRDLVAAHRRGDGWAAIAGQLSNRTGQQCRCRFESLIALQQRAAARLPASSPAPAVVQAEVAAGGNPAAAAGAADPADPRPSRRRQLRVAVYRGPAAVAGAVGPANPPSDSASDDEGSDSSTPPSKRVPVGRNPAMATGAVGPANPPSDSALDDEEFAFPIPPSDSALDDEAGGIFDSKTYEFFEKLRGVPVGDGDGAAATGAADAIGFANPPPDPVFVFVQAGVPVVGDLYPFDAIFDHEACEFFEKLRNPFVPEDEI